MTLDDLDAIYHRAYRENYDSRAGIKAVILALRGEISEDCDDCDQPWWSDAVHKRFDEILCEQSPEVKAGFSANKGEENDGCIQEEVSFIKPRRSATAGDVERYGNKLTRTAHASPAGAGDGAGKDEAGRECHVGGESNHGVSCEKAAGGPTREDGRGIGSTGTATPANVVTTPAADLSVGQRLVKAAKEASAIARGTDASQVCEWTGEEYVTYSTSCESEYEVDPHKAPPTRCPSCGKPISFTEVK